MTETGVSHEVDWTAVTGEVLRSFAGTPDARLRHCLEVLTRLLATGRHPYRPAHIHFLITAAGFAPLTARLLVAGSPYLDADPVFAVKASLVREFTSMDDPDTAAAHGLPNPYRHASIDLVLALDGAGPRSR